MEFIKDYLINLYELFIDMSFYIMLGLLLVGILHTFVNKKFITRQIGDNSLWSVIKASVIGVPLPLCSCGVVPTAIELKKSGGSNGAVVSFLTSTPQTGVDSIIATWGMLGPVMAFFRAIASFISGIFAGIMVNVFAKNEKIKTGELSSCHCSHEEESSCHCSHEEESSCQCSHEEESSCQCSHEEESTCHCSHEEESTCHCSHEDESTCHCSHEDESSCHCSHEEEHACACSSTNTTTIGFLGKIKSVFSYGFFSFLEEIAGRFVIGLLISALITTLIPADFFVKYGLNNGIVSMLLMVLIGLPMYICSTSSIPVAVSLMMKGLSPGAAFVFLFTGPITNFSSLLMLSKSLGKKITTIYVSCAVVMSIAFGLLFDFLTGLGMFRLEHTHIHDHHHELSILVMIVAVVFLALLIRTFVMKFIKKKQIA